jgi:hypothetical protein
MRRCRTGTVHLHRVGHVVYRSLKTLVFGVAVSDPYSNAIASLGAVRVRRWRWRAEKRGNTDLA